MYTRVGCFFFRFWRNIKKDFSYVCVFVRLKFYTKDEFKNRNETILEKEKNKTQNEKGAYFSSYKWFEFSALWRRRRTIDSALIGSSNVKFSKTLSLNFPFLHTFVPVFRNFYINYSKICIFNSFNFIFFRIKLIFINK